MNTNGNISTLDQAIQVLRDLEAEADADVKASEQILASAKAAQRRVRAMLKAAGVIEEAKKPKPKPKGVSERKLDEILLSITAYSRTVKRQFVASEIVEFSKISQPTVNLAINVLRERGELRKVGLDGTRFKRALYELEGE
jgi:hypothetical protein